MTVTSNLDHLDLEQEDDTESTAGFSVVSSATESPRTVRHATKPGESWVWQYFDKNVLVVRSDGSDGRPCPIQGCKTVIKAGNSPIGLARHLNKHNIFKDGVGAAGQRTLASFLTPNANVVSYTQKDFREALADFVVSAALPYTIVENPSLQKIINVAAYAPHLNMKLPCATTITRDIKERFDISKSRVKSILTQQRYLAYTADAWTSPWKMPILAVTAHWIDEKWQYRSIPIGFELLEGSHTGENLATAFLAVLSDWGIQDKPFYLTMDNAKNMDAMARHISFLLPDGIFDAKENRVPCVAHILNLAAQAVLKEGLKAQALETEVETTSTIDIEAQSADEVGSDHPDEVESDDNDTRGMSHYDQYCLILVHVSLNDDLLISHLPICSWRNPQASSPWYCLHSQVSSKVAAIPTMPQGFSKLAQCHIVF